ncbi:MAG TPA: DNA polymerase III subunit delta [Gemmataceae bacterium]|nr:DNA polymerase III subunit delta [Gemmataceae bacterium]
MDSLTYLERGGKAKVLPLYVLHGDEPFLKRQVLLALRERILGEGADDSAVSVHAGDKATFAAVYDELETAPFFHPRRLVMVENADPFVTRFRGTLEKKVGDMPATGVLILDVKTWAANTKLYKLVGEESAIACKAPAAYKLPRWCATWCRAQYGKDLSPQAASLLVDLVGPEMGLLAQELEKLAIFVGDGKKIDADDVDRLVGHSRSENTWKIFDAIAASRTGEALSILDRLFDQGEEPLRILGAFSMQLRRLAQAAHISGQGKTLRTALEQAGVPPFAVQAAEQQLRHLGRPRAERLYDWLLEMNMGMRGGSPLSERTLLERFVVRLARKE